jgi:arsenate reductase
MVQRHDDDHQAAQHVDGGKAVTALIGNSIHDCDPSYSLCADLETFGRLEQLSLMRTTIFGIRNCDTMKKARTWLKSRGVEYEFHDYKESGVSRATLVGWAKVVGWETLLNRTGTTFRKLPDQAKENLDERKAIALMLEQPSMIKRPVLARGKTLLVGFSPEKYSVLK